MQYLITLFLLILLVSTFVNSIPRPMVSEINPEPQTSVIGLVDGVCLKYTPCTGYYDNQVTECYVVPSGFECFDSVSERVFIYDSEANFLETIIL